MKKLTLLLLFVAGLCYSHDELAEQVEVITVQIKRSPHQAELYFQRAELYRADAHWKEAEKDYLKAKKLAPAMIANDLGLGLLYLSMNRLKESSNFLDRFIAQRPDHAEARVALGHALSKLGDRAKAVEEYSKALALRPDPEIYIERSRLLSSQNHLQKAVEGLNEGIQALGPIVTMELYAIELEIQLKQYDSALSRVERIAEQSERKETWLAQKGDILTQASRTEEARAAYLAAIEALQNLSESRLNSRYTRELKERIRIALEQLENNELQ